MKNIDRTIERARAGTITRSQALAEIAAAQSEGIRQIGLAERAHDIDDSRCHEFEIVGASLDPLALIVRATNDGREMLAPFKVETRKSGPTVVWQPLEVSPSYVAAQKDTAAAARERATITTDTAKATADPIDPFHVTVDPDSHRKAVAKASRPENRPVITRGPGGSLTITVPSEKTKTAVRAKARAALETAKAAQKVDRWGDPC